MPYLNETGLAYYNEKLQPWISSQPSKTLPSSLYPWTLTDKTGAVTCWPVGGTPLLPTVDFLFTETGPAEGEKSPTNPSTITGVSTITVTRCETVGVDETQYTVDLGGTYYGGTIDLATGVMTVTHVSVLFNGNTYFSSSIFEEYTSAYRLGFYPSLSRRKSQPAPEDVASNTILATVGAAQQDVSSFNFSNNSYVINIILTKSDAGLPSGATYSDVAAAFNTFFSSHPTRLVYPVAEPTTVTLTPPQILALAQADRYTPRLNTLYTDASAVQVGYVKSPIREEYELTQAIVAQGGNI